MPPAAPASQPVHLEFDDNRLLPLLFGEYDQNLVRIEQQLGVSLVSRGNHLAISGPPDSVETARETLTALYQRLKRGQNLDRADVDTALRFARTPGEPNLFDRMSGDGTAVRTQRRLISPRSAGAGGIYEGAARGTTWCSASVPPAPARPIWRSPSPSPC